MQIIQHKVLLNSFAEYARKSVAGLTLAQALAQFASLDRSPSEESLRKDVLEQAEKHPLSSIIPMSIHDDEGKVVAKSPGLAPAGEPEDERLLDIWQSYFSKTNIFN